MIRYILFALFAVIVASTYNIVLDNNYELYNREIIYNKWEKIDIKKPHRRLRIKVIQVQPFDDL